MGQFGLICADLGWLGPIWALPLRKITVGGREGMPMEALEDAILRQKRTRDHRDWPGLLDHLSILVRHGSDDGSAHSATSLKIWITMDF